VNTLESRPLPSLRKLATATVIAVLVAAAILVTAVLPAEYGVDPTGVGRYLGLTAMSSAGKQDEGAARLAAAPAKPALAAGANDATAIAALTQIQLTLRTDEMSLVLPPGKGAEIKASMEQGERFVYEWTSGSTKVDFDMHGEPRNAKGDEFTSFLKGMQNADQGMFIAPFSGTHGWYWENVGKDPVTVRIKVSGFYEKLYKP
jgi:hypothetical protein